ncbi:MAG: crotonase/enoyl-CoA hydratase family protein [Noviherbaspirillum sp.]
MEQANSTGTFTVELTGAVAIVSLDRVARRNALDDATIAALHDFFEEPPAGVKAVVVQGRGDHFCAGLDLSEVRGRDTADAVRHSRSWHRAFERIQFGQVPVIAVMKGATIGGGLELASACHVRVAEQGAFYALPEGQRGLFVGGGGSVRISRLIGVARMTDLMLTGRVLSADEGHQAGVSQYLVEAGAGLAKALELAQKAAANAPMTNYGIMHVLPRIVQQSIQDGLMTEALMAAVAQSDPQTQDRLAAFLDRKQGKIKPN